MRKLNEISHVSQAIIAYAGLGLGLKLNTKGLIFANTFLTLGLIFLFTGGIDVIAEYF